MTLVYSGAKVDFLKIQLFFQVNVVDNPAGQHILSDFMLLIGDVANVFSSILSFSKS